LPSPHGFGETTLTRHGFCHKNVQMTQLVPLIASLIGFAISVLANTVILLVALIIMLKVQKMDIKWLWLIGAALLASLLDTIFSNLDFPFASRIGHLLAVVSLWLNIYYMSTAEPIDATFTVSVGYAVKFTLNMFLLTAMIGDLRPDLKTQSDMAVDDETNAPEKPVATAPAKVPAQTAEKTPAAAPAKPAKPAPVAQSNAPAQPVPIAPPPPGNQSTNTMTPDQVGQIVKNFSLKGIVPPSTGGAAALTIINTGIRNYTMSPGDAIEMDTGAGRYKIRCQKITDRTVVLNVGGQPVTLSLPEEKELIIQ
jgi:hypothetical protein